MSCVLMNEDSSNGAPCTVSIDMDEIAQKVQFVPQRTLQDIARGPLVQYTLTCEDNQKVSRVWRSLLQTLSTSSLSHQHTSAACSAVIAFIDSSINSQNEETKRLILTSHNWLALFDVFLNRYEDAKPKPLRQLLASLTSIMAKHYHGPSRTLVQAKIVEAVIPSIVLGEPRSRLKGCLVCLELFVRKGAILPSELLQLARQWLAPNMERCVSAFGKDSFALFLRTQPTSSIRPDELSDEMAAKVFVFGLLTQTNNKEMASSSGGLLKAFLQRMKTEAMPEVSQEHLSTIWVTPARHLVLQNMNTLETQCNQLLEPLFTVDPSGFRIFVETLPLKSLLQGDMSEAPLDEYMLLFATLRVGKKINLVHDDHGFSDPSGFADSARSTLVLRSEVIGKFLLHREPSIRLAALSLLITAVSTTKPLTPAAFEAMLRGLPSMHADSDSYTRGEMLSLTRKLIVRLKGGILKRDSAKAPHTVPGKQISDRAKTDEETKSFLKAYIHFLERDLCVTASYARHITALKALRLLVESGLDSRTDIKPVKSELENRWRVHMEIFHPGLLRLLLDLLLDPFEEVRATSLSIVNQCPQHILMSGLLNTANDQPGANMKLTDAISRAESIASNTSRADNADTVARLYHVIFCAASGSCSAGSSWWATKVSVVDTILQRLEDRLSSPKGIFTSSMREAPLHGYMSGLRYIVLTPNFQALVSAGYSSLVWRSLHDRIVAICDKIWLEVKPVLCIDSPEGHTDEPIEDLSVGPKDILSYSWRALRESSMLLHATMVNQTYGPPGDDGLQPTDFEKVGRASFTQLAELRHRGAFSTVSQTFATCCERCSKSDNPLIRELPRQWYQEAKTTIFESASKLTRRSAGLPALVTGILCSDPATTFFKEAMEELHEISRLPVEYDKDQQYLKLPQVHAMNCLKDIFTSTKLGQYSEPFIMSALTLSAERLGSPIWALRNSGLMLFRALLSKMCRLVSGTGLGFGGSSGSEPGARVSFPKYPGLLELLSHLLTPNKDIVSAVGGSTDIVTERVFPALELVGEKIPTYSDNHDTMLRALVLEHMKSPVWGIREHAARVYASLLTRNNILQDVSSLVEISPSAATENYLHGIALCVRYSLRRFSSTTDVYWTTHIQEFLGTVRRVFAFILPLARSPAVATALTEVLNDAVERAIKAEIEAKTASFLDEILEEFDLHGILTHVFDASHAGWNISSLTRASSLLRRALAWYMTLKMLVSGKWEELTQFYFAVTIFDADAARWILEELEELLGGKKRYRKPLAVLYASAILADSPPNIKTAAASNLASILEGLLVSELDTVKGMSLPWEKIGGSFRPESNIQLWNRDATDAELRLRGCLLTISIASGEWQSPSSLDGELRGWALKLRSALSEETEFTSRYAAVASLGSFSRVLRVPNYPPRVDPVMLDIYLALYDMLNDDDEELRDMAAATASWALSYSSVSPDAAVALGPLNASALLAEFIANNFAEFPTLTETVVRYITGQQPRLSCSDRPSRLLSVSDMVAEHRKESTVLFMEEKQNLFIDGVREVDVWAPALLRLKESAYKESVVHDLACWASQGLAYLTELAGERAGQDGLLGWISKPETFTLGVRLIGIASVLVAENFPLRNYMSGGQDELRRQMQSLWVIGGKAFFHDEWLSRIQQGLGAGVTNV